VSSVDCTKTGKVCSGGVCVGVNGVCGSVNNTCAKGDPSDVSDTEKYYVWNCVGTGGGATKSLSNLKMLSL
jgi:hypothetical protein